MPESPSAQPTVITPIVVEWRSDNSNQIRLAAWHTQQVRRSKAFQRYRARQLISVHAIMLIPAAALAFVLSTSGGSFSSIMVGATTFLVVFAALLILRGGRLSTPAALRLAAQLEKAGAIPDTSGQWRFSLDDLEAVWEWLDQGFRISWPVDRLAPPEEFDGTLMFSHNGLPVGLVPLPALTEDQRATIQHRFSWSHKDQAPPST